MESYAKPTIRALVEDAGSCGCNFRFNETPRDCNVGTLPGVIDGRGPCVTVDAGETPSGPIDLTPIGTNTILGVNDGSIAVTPLANTNIPGTQAINFGIPVGTRGIYADISLQQSSIGTGSAVGLTYGGTQVVSIPLP